MQFMIILRKLLEGIRSKCDWYEHGEMSIKFFLSLEKQRGAQNTIKKLIADDKEIIRQDTYFRIYKRIL